MSYSLWGCKESGMIEQLTLLALGCSGVTPTLLITCPDPCLLRASTISSGMGNWVALRLPVGNEGLSVFS